MKNVIIGLTGLLFIAITIGIALTVKQKNIPENIPIDINNNVAVCDQDSKTCPDGSTVRRTGSTCEFSLCPTTNNNSSQETFYSNNLGISFQFLKFSSGQAFSTKIVENRVYVFASNTDYQTGQFVEIFSKDPNEPIAETIRWMFVPNANPKECIVESYSDTENSRENWTKLHITYQKSITSPEALMQKLKYCNEDYARTNGVRYFLYDTNHPNRFLFVNIGQYSIPAENGKAWQETIQFLD